MPCKPHRGTGIDLKLDITAQSCLPLCFWLRLLHLSQRASMGIFKNAYQSLWEEWFLTYKLYHRMLIL